MRTVIILALICSFLNSIGQNSQPDLVEHRLDGYVLEALDKWRVPGIAICIVKDGEVLVSKGYGVTNIEKADSVDENTLFLIGSTTKAFTATAITQLAIEKGFSLDDPIINWIPSLELSDPWLTKIVTIQDLLSHRSGLNKFAGDFIFFGTDLKASEYIEKFKYLPAENEFKSFSYTNAGYFLVGEIIQKITGMTYPSYMEESIFEPLGMKRTGANTSAWSERENYASPHVVDQNGELVVSKVGKADNMSPGGGIYSTSSDLGNWLLAQLDSGKVNGMQVLRPEVVLKVREPKILIGRTGMPYAMFNRSQFEHYSSGWYNMDYEGREFITHNGGMYGFTSSVTLIPEIDLGIAILTNSDNHLLFETIKLEIVDSFLQLPFRDYSNIAHRFYEFQKNQKSNHLAVVRNSIKPLNSLDNLEPYIGTYSNEVYGELELEMDNEEFVMKFQHHNMQASLNYLSEGRFLCTYDDPIYGIEVSEFLIENNEIVGFMLSVDANVEPNSYFFKKVNN
ncbi:serine hydrolase [Ekhidna sp.]|uniref:serine hydrolase n=1 Tax=Ekhidna sp. TaxID=2608089 RepID=UPI0032983F35